VNVWRESPVDDASAHALLTEYFASRAADFPPSQGAYRTVFPTPADFEPPRGVFLVVVQDSADVGCGGIRRLDDTTYEVKHLWVRPAARGIGLGRQLLTELEARARAFGATRTVLDTNESLREAGTLYRSSGYVEIEPYNDNRNATTWFEKNL
jgi:GNAT superfamily N-acetyltransferase